MTSISAELGIVNLKSRRGNLFASADGAAAWGIQASPLLEGKAALFTGGWFNDKTLRAYGLFNMFEMIEGFPFFNPESLRDLSEIKQFFF